MGRTVGFIGLLAWVTGCAATATATSAPAEDAAAGGVSLRVGLGPLVPPTYRAGVRVRASDGRGQTVDALTDASGWVRLPLDASRRWNVTAAEPGHAAVSLVGVAVPAETEVYLRATTAPRPAEVRDVTVTGVIRGRTSPRTAVLLDGATGTTVARDDTFTVSVPTWPGASPSQIVAIELDDVSSFLNGAISEPVVLGDGSPSVVVAFPSTPVRPSVQELRVDLPVLGRVTAAAFGSVLSETVVRVKYTAAGAGLMPVGRSQLRRPTDPSAARWSVEAFEGALAPELITATARFGAGPAAVLGSVTTRPSFRGVVPSFGAVTSLAATTSATGATTLTADAEAWSRAAFTVSADGAVVWEGYAFDGRSWRDEPLPTLPQEVRIGALAATTAVVTARACVLRDLPLAPRPWASPMPALSLRNLITVCEESGTIVPVR